MTARVYDMRKRARGAAETRARILEAAHELLGRNDGGSLALPEVAEAAGVSRATIYNRIGTRRDLLAAVFEDQGRRIDYDRVLRAMDLEDPVAAVVTSLRESCRAWAVMPDAIRRTLALAVIDAEVGDLVRRYEGYRRVRLRTLASRLVDRGAVADALSPQDITSTLVLFTSFQAYDHLRLDHDARLATSQLVAMLIRTLGLPATLDDTTP